MITRIDPLEVSVLDRWAAGRYSSERRENHLTLDVVDRLVERPPGCRRRCRRELLDAGRLDRQDEPGLSCVSPGVVLPEQSDGRKCRKA